MTQKLDKEHVEQIRDLQEKFNANTRYLGTLTIDEEMLNLQLQNIKENKTALIAEFNSLREQESALLEKLKERYGDGQIDITTGTFTPNEVGQ